MTARLLVFLCVVSVSLFAQVARQGLTPPAAGKLIAFGSLSGHVSSSGEVPRPIRRARVTLTGTPLTSPLFTVTDDQGAWYFDQLAPGDYQLLGEKVGYVATRYGAKRTSSPGLSVAIRAGERLTDLDISLPPGGSISGRIIDARGEPLPSAEVSLMRFRSDGGRRILEDAHQTASTDDLGEYRFFGLAAADYEVMLSSREFSRGPSAFVQIQEGEVDLALRQSVAGGLPVASSASPLLGFAATFFPGTADAAAAQTVTVARGEARTGVDFALQLVPMASIQGVIVDRNGHPQSGVHVRIRPAQTTTMAALFPFAPGGRLAERRTDSAGRFDFVPVPPGDFALAATTAPSGASAPIDTLCAYSPVSVAGAAISVRLTLGQCGSITGRVVLNASPPSSRTTLSNATVRVEPAGTESAARQWSPNEARSTRPALDGSFELHGLLPGEYSLIVSIGDADSSLWSAASAVANGLDYLDTPLVISADAPITDLVVTLEQTTMLSGSVINSSRVPTSSYDLVIFSTDRRWWFYGSRRITATRPSSSGVYQVRGLPPGEYAVAALTDLEEHEWFDPQFLASLDLTSLPRVELGPHEHKIQDLRVGGLH